MNIAEVVEEIIAGEEVDRADIADVANEIAAMVALNQELNNALQLSSDKLAKAHTARDAAIKHLKLSGLEWMHDIITIVEDMSQGGTHRDKDAKQLEAIKKLMCLVKSIQYGIRKAGGMALEEITALREMEDIPF